MTHPRQRNGIDHARCANRYAPAPLQLHIEEAEIETGIVRNERRIADEFKKLVNLVREQRLVRQEAVGQSMNLLGSRRHGAFGIEIGVESVAGHHPADHFDTSYLHHPVPCLGIKACGLGIEDNLSHSVARCEPVLQVMQDPHAAF